MYGSDPRWSERWTEPAPRRRALWTPERLRPLLMHTPPGVAPQTAYGRHAPAQAAWWYAASVVAAITVGLWTWRAVFAVLFPLSEDVQPYASLRAPAPQPPAAASAASPPAAATRAAPDNTAASLRKPALAARSRPLPAPPVAATPLAPDAKPDLDLMDAPSSPLELQALAEARAREPVSLEGPPPIRPTFVYLNSRPWSQVYLDGQLVGHTPLRGLRVLPGHYDVQLVNREFGMSKRFELLLREGESITRSEELADE